MENANDLFLQSNTTASITESLACTQLKVQKHAFTWIIDNFSERGDQVGDILVSPTFPACRSEKQKWVLRLYIRGQSDTYENNLSLFLKPFPDVTAEVRTKFVFYIINALNEKTNGDPIVHKFDTIRNKAWGIPNFMARDVLLGNAEELLPDNKLTLFCDLNVFEDIPKISGQIGSIQVPECRYYDELGKLFERQVLSDVFFCSADGHEFSGHKAILAARSVVFFDMFECGMKESTLGRVEIPDMDYAVLKEMMNYIYTGKVTNMEERPEDLLVAADKYQLDHLKVMCEDFLSKKISVSNAVEFLIFADRYNAEQLKAFAIHFISRHAKRVMETVDWREMNQTHPSLVTEVLRDLAEQLESLIGLQEK